jgi:hypothetical protein
VVRLSRWLRATIVHCSGIIGLMAERRPPAAASLTPPCRAELLAVVIAINAILRGVELRPSAESTADNRAHGARDGVLDALNRTPFRPP